VQRAGGVAALVQVALVLVTLAIAFLGLGGVDPGAPGDVTGAPEGTLLPLQALEVIKVLQAGAGLVLVFGLAARLGPDWPGAMGLAVVAGAAGAALLLASGGVGYASLTLYQLIPRPEEGPGQAVLPVSVLSSALNAVVSGLGIAAVCATGCWAALAGGVGWQTRRLSQPLSALLLAWGVAGVLAFVVPGLILLTLVLGLVAAAWLAAVLLRAPPG
jgi:hypothetical protein